MRHMSRLFRAQQQARFLATKEAFKAPTSRRTGRWLQVEPKDLCELQRAFIERLKELCPATAEVGELAGWLGQLVKEQCPAQLDDWLDTAQRSTVAELAGFVRSLRKHC